MSLLARVKDLIAHFHLTGYASELPTSVTTVVEHVAETVENELKAIEKFVEDKFAALRAELKLAPAPVVKQPDPVVQPAATPAATPAPAGATEPAPAATDLAPAAQPAAPAA